MIAIVAFIWLGGALALTVLASTDRGEPNYGVILLWPVFVALGLVALPFQAAEWLGRKLSHD